MRNSDAGVSRANTGGEPAWLPELWRGLEACGWLEDVPAGEHEALRRRLAACEERGEAYADLSVIEFDAECIDGPGSYADIIRRLADASRGQFRPESIGDTWDDDGHMAHVAFDVGDERFEVHVKIDDDWFQDEVFELVNDALKAAGAPQRFVPLPVPDQIIYAAFVRPETFERATELGVIPTAEDVLAQLGDEVAQLDAAMDAVEARAAKAAPTGRAPALKSKATTKRKAARRLPAKARARPAKKKAAKKKVAKKKVAKKKVAKERVAKEKVAKKKVAKKEPATAATKKKAKRR